MANEESVKLLTDIVASFVCHISKKLPDDVVAKLEELGRQETAPLPKVLYETMTKNQKLAVELDRPSCQDTGVLQYWVKCGTAFPLINELEALLKEATVQATFTAPCVTTPLRPSTSTTPSATSARAPPPCGGTSSPTPTSARSMPIWPAAAAPCPARPWS